MRSSTIALPADDSIAAVSADIDSNPILFESFGVFNTCPQGKHNRLIADSRYRSLGKKTSHSKETCAAKERCT